MQYHTYPTAIPNRAGYNANQTTNLNLKSVPSHARLVLVDHRLAFLCGILGFREQHAVISGGLLGFADAARLFLLDRLALRITGLERRTLGFSVWEEGEDAA